MSAQQPVQLETSENPKLGETQQRRLERSKDIERQEDRLPLLLMVETEKENLVNIFPYLCSGMRGACWKKGGNASRSAQGIPSIPHVFPARC